MRGWFVALLQVLPARDAATEKVASRLEPTPRRSPVGILATTTGLGTVLYGSSFRTHKRSGLRKLASERREAGPSRR